MSVALDQVAPRAWRPSTRSPGSGLGIERGNYIAIAAPEPERAAQFAVDHMGFALVHVDAEQRHYLAAHGPDPYSLVYVPGKGGVDHVSFVVGDLAALDAAQAALHDAGITYEQIDASPLWRHEPAVRFEAFGCTTIELTSGIRLPAPPSEVLAAPAAVPGPLAFDHAILRQADVEKGIAFASGPLGLKESGRILAPDGVAILAFFRGRTLFHCFGVARSRYDGLHHYQFTLKNDRAVIAAYEAMVQDPAIEMLWGPVRHACGQNIAFYFRDALGNVVEYSSEEELILCDEAYEVLHWPVENQRATDEWGTHPPDAIRG